MKIRNEKAVLKKITLRDIEQGECYWYPHDDSSLYMKISGGMVITLKNGRLFHKADLDAIVKPADAEIVVCGSA